VLEYGAFFTIDVLIDVRFSGSGFDHMITLMIEMVGSMRWMFELLTGHRTNCIWDSSTLLLLGACNKRRFHEIRFNVIPPDPIIFSGSTSLLYSIKYSCRNRKLNCCGCKIVNGRTPPESHGGHYKKSQLEFFNETQLNSIILLIFIYSKFSNLNSK